MTRPKIRLLVLGTAITLLASSIALLAYAFRVETFDNPHLGMIENQYRWGRAYEVRADTNRDGAINFRARIEPAKRYLGQYESPNEYWEDRDHDGSFEVHVVRDDDTIMIVEIDQDGDGNYDHKLTGEAAENFYSNLSAAEDQ